ncbi:MAG TPA: TauD/TfdA family dioxygenase [Thermoanaerobaculia bacterium]|nr:TauD/TfdA family dioxygenase [Thermoanaerobaculia bacterium]
MSDLPKPPKKLALGARRAAVAPAGELVREEGGLPLVLTPAVPEVDVFSWAAASREGIEEKLQRHGALLFRGFGVEGTDGLQRFVRAVCGDLLEYRERSSPRHELADRVYTSTDYPAAEAIFPHNEHSYAKRFPLKLFFSCVVPPETGGETPVGDTRRIFARIDPGVRERFARSGWMYVRNFHPGFGLSWQTVFQTDDRAKVEAYCRDAGIGFEWRPGDRLRTRQVRPATAVHPRTGETVWFNHATFFHVSTLSPAIREPLLKDFGTDDLPNNTYYGDGSPIEPEVVEHLRRAYLDEMTAFPWGQGDVLLIDNMLTAHARNPFTGPRKIAVAMADPHVREDLP